VAIWRLAGVQSKLAKGNKFLKRVRE